MILGIAKNATASHPCALFIYLELIDDYALDIDVTINTNNTMLGIENVLSIINCCQTLCH
jgi:hypothetical protein